MISIALALPAVARPLGLVATVDRCRGGRHLLVEWKRASKPPRYRLSPMAVRCASKGEIPELQPLPLPPAAPTTRKPQSGHGRPYKYQLYMQKRQ